MKTLWSKGLPLDDAIAAFTVGDDRVNDALIARHDILGSLAHVKGLLDADLLSPSDADALTRELRQLYAVAETDGLAPGSQDEDIHSAVERILTQKLGDPGRRLHTARSRNDQVATDMALWMREQALSSHQEVLGAAIALIDFAETHQHVLLPGMTHLQPAMPSSFGLWAAGYAELLLNDAALLRAACDAVSACPLGSAAGYGVPAELAPIDRAVTARALAFSRVAEPVTAVQGGRGKPEATLLFAMAQCATTCARLARDIVLYVNPAFGWVHLPDQFTTGSSIMPQKRNPDVMELVRGNAAVVQGALFEVMTLATSVPSGYHRDFQLLKGPSIRAVQAARASLQMIAHVVPAIIVNVEKAAEACTPELYATHRALELVVAGKPFRSAYGVVAQEVREKTLPDPGQRPLPLLNLRPIQARLEDASRWQSSLSSLISGAFSKLLGRAEP